MEAVFWIEGHRFTHHRLEGSNIIGMERFKSLFGVSPKVCSDLWDLLASTRPTNAKPKHMLYALLFLKVYPIERGQAEVQAQCDRRTFMTWSWTFVKLIAALDNVVRVFI